MIDRNHNLNRSSESRSVSRLAPLNPNRLDPALKAAIVASEERFSDLPNFLQVLAHSPQAVRAYILSNGALAEGQLTARQREQIALLLAEINDSEYSLAAHAEEAARQGMSSAEIQAARQADSADPRAAALLRFVQVVTLCRGAIQEKDLAALRGAGFNDAQVIEAIANIALNVFCNYLNKVAGIVVDSPPVQAGADI